MEFVFVAPREELFPACYPQGFHAFSGGAGQQFVERLAATGFFVERARAERTPAWKQVIPYCVVQHEGRILRMRRRPKGGEARLFDKLTIGVGGHINPVDQESTTSTLFARAARRELEEELEVRGEYELRLCGFLNDDSNPVGAVHLGLIHVVTCMEPVGIREHDVLVGELIEPEQLLSEARRGEDFETWSRTLIDHLGELRVHAPATT